MKVETKPTVFQPVTITLESIQEVNMIRSLLAPTTANFDTACGLPAGVGYDLFNRLDGVCHAANEKIVRLSTTLLPKP